MSCKKVENIVQTVIKIAPKRQEKETIFRDINAMNVVRNFNQIDDQKSYKIKFLKSTFIKDKHIKIQQINIIKV